jgi:hypothetical protein
VCVVSECVVCRVHPYVCVVCWVCTHIQCGHMFCVTGCAPPTYLCVLCAGCVPPYLSTCACIVCRVCTPLPIYLRVCCVQGVYAMKASTLQSLLEGECRECKDLGKEVIPKAQESGYKLQAFPFGGR